MEYKKYENTYLLRLDPGDEILDSLTLLAEKENIMLAGVQGIGAVNDVAAGVFKTGEKEYLTERFTGDFEILNLTGNISRQDKKPYLHLHISIGNPAAGVWAGGHLSRALVSATAEITVTKIQGEANRVFDESIGLNIFQFS
ncbi:MAG: PPC domain-containing DNA-binding protein [Ruminococcus sp.]|jgi:predicted DNA-binding protein with PD1-like motif